MSVNRGGRALASMEAAAVSSLKTWGTRDIGVVRRQRLSDEQAKRAIAAGEFSEELRRSAAHVAVVLTQAWCPQWAAMKRWLDSLDREANRGPLDLAVYELEYDTVEYFHPFMRFKETVFANSLVPYVRYYRDGRFLGDSNFVSRDVFLKRFAAPAAVEASSADEVDGNGGA
jgi:hypothetical protein